MAVIPKRQIVLGALATAFDRSPAGQALGPAVLDQYFEIQCPTLFDGRTLRLQPLYDAFGAEPGVRASDLIAPMLALRSWEGILSAHVELPRTIELLDAATRSGALAGFGLGMTEAARLINARAERLALPPAPVARIRITDVLGVVADEPPAPAARKRERAIDVEPQPQPTATSRGVRLPWSAAIALVLALGGGVVFAYLSLREPEDAAFDVAALRKLLPLRDAARRGPYAVAVIDDPQWNRRSVKDRTDRVGALLDRLQESGIGQIVLTDGAKHVLAVGAAGRKPPVKLSDVPP
ncbi:MAG: hypothetical protein AABZ30_13725 [Myxococcota bacterium]